MRVELHRKPKGPTSLFLIGKLRTASATYATLNARIVQGQVFQDFSSVDLGTKM